MAPAISFDAQSKRGVLERCASSDAPQILRVHPDRPAADAAPVIEMVVAKGQVFLARAGRWNGIDALLWVAIANSGRVELEPAPSTGPGPGTPVQDVLAEADVAARAFLDHLAPLGGVGAVLVADLDGLVERLANIPDAANALLRVVDGRRTIAAIAREAGFETSLTARILSRLFAMEVLRSASAPDDDPLLPAPSRQPGRTSDAIAPTPSHWEPPASGWGETEPLPNDEEVEAEEAEDEIVGWLSAEDAPPPLLSDDAFTNAFAAIDPLAPTDPPSLSEAPTPEPVTPVAPVRSPEARVRARVPISTRRPAPAEASAPTDEVEAAATHAPDDDEFLREAGVGGGGSNTNLFVAIAAIIVLVGVIWALGRGGSGHETPDAGMVPPPPPPVATTTTATVATSSVTADEDINRTTIAGPDAPEDVKRAERLLDSGRYREAGELLDQLQTSRPDDASVFVLSGQVYVDTGRLGPAMTMADRAITIDPRSYRAWVLRGSVEQFRGRYAEAIAAYERAAKLGPNHPMAPEIESVLEQLRRRTP